MSPLEWSLCGVLGLGVAFVVAELLARALLRRRGGYFPLVPHQRQRFELDRDALPMLEPVVHWNVNKDGERGGRVPKDAARVLLAGGSCVESYYLDQPSSVAGQLEVALAGQFGGRKVHVGSVARSRISCEQIRLMLGKSLPRYARLDCVILMVGASDLVRWLELGAPTEPWSDEASLSHLFGQHPEGPFGWRPGQLALRALLARGQRRFFPRVETRSRVGKRLATLRLRRQAAEPKLDSVTDPSLMLERFALHLGLLIDDLSQVAERVVLARQPCFAKDLSPEEEPWMWNFGQGEIYATEVVTYYTHRVVRELMAQVAERAGEVARAAGALDVDIPNLLEPGLENYYDYMHFTPKGAERVASLIAEAMAAEGKDLA